MRVALVGPSAPYRGGIVDHTNALARELDRAEVLAEFAAWGRQFPKFAHPSGVVPFRGKDDPTPIAQTTFDLHWNRPDSWVRVGRRLSKAATHLVFAVTSPLQLPAFRAITAAFRSSRSATPRTVNAIFHNVLPHEPSIWDRALSRALLTVADSNVVHATQQAAEAAKLGAANVRVLVLPFHPPQGVRLGRHPGSDRRFDRLAFLGFVREYKGLDILLRAIARAKTRPHLVVLGEFWEPRARYDDLIEELRLTDRVNIHDGFATGPALSSALSEVDGMVLPYRSATASQQPRLAFAHGVPVIATEVGGLTVDLRHGVDAMICEPTVSGLARTIDAFYTDGQWLHLRRRVSPPDPAAEWSSYLSGLGVLG